MGVAARGLALGVLVLAVWVRSQGTAFTHYTFDQANIYSRIRAFVDLGQWPLVGITTSTGFHPPPLLLYVLAPTYLISPDLQIAAALAGLLGVVGVAAILAAGWRFWGPVTGLAAGALMASSVWLAYFTTRVAGEALVPAVSALLLLSLLRAVEERPAGWAGAAAFLLVVMPQVHLAAMAALPAAAVFLLWFRRRVGWRGFFLGLVAGAVTVAPYGLWLAGHGLPAALGPGLDLEPPRLDATAGRQMVLLLSAARFGPFFGQPEGAPFREPPLAGPLEPLVPLLVLAGVGLALYRAVRHRDRPSLLALLWLLGTIGALSLHWYTVHVHYILVGVPAGFLLAGSAVGAVWRSRVLGRGTAAVALALVLAPSLYQAISYARLTAWLGHEAVTPLHGVPWSVWRATGSGLEEAGGGRLFVGALSGEHKLLVRYVLASEAITFFDPNAALPASAKGEARYLILGQGTEAGRMLGECCSLAREIEVPGGSGAFRVWQAPAREVTAIQGAAAGGAPLARWPHGVALLDVRIEDLGDEGLRVRHLWEVEKLPAELGAVDFVFFYHVIGAADRAKVAQWDGSGYPLEGWAMGDRVLTVASIDRTESGQVHEVLLGTYAWPSIERLPPIESKLAVREGALVVVPRNGQ